MIENIQSIIQNLIIFEIIQLKYLEYAILD
jgi:hypothetical protein